MAPNCECVCVHIQKENNVFVDHGSHIIILLYVQFVISTIYAYVQHLFHYMKVSTIFIHTEKYQCPNLLLSVIRIEIIRLLICADTSEQVFIGRCKETRAYYRHFCYSQIVFGFQPIQNRWQHILCVPNIFRCVVTTPYSFYNTLPTSLHYNYCVLIVKDKICSAIAIILAAIHREANTTFMYYRYIVIESRQKNL